MRRFKSTPRKKLIGMAILFVFIPLFLLWYVVFFLGNKPDSITLAIIACVALLAAYFYWKYRKRAASGTGEESLEGEGDEGIEGDEGPEAEPEEELEPLEGIPEGEPVKTPKN